MRRINDTTRRGRFGGAGDVVRAKLVFCVRLQFGVELDDGDGDGSIVTQEARSLTLSLLEQAC